MDGCKARRTDGSECRAQALREGKYCFFHDPDTRAARIEAARKGGSRRAVELPEAELLTPERAQAILAGVIEAVASGAMDSGTARTVGYLVQIEGRIREGRDFVRRIDALEQVQRKAG